MRIAHLIAVHGEAALAAVSPALDSRFSIQQLTLLCSESEASSAENTAMLIRDKGLAVKILRLANTWSPGNIKKALEIALSQYDGDCFSALNLSGANPVFASIGTQVFRARRQPVFTVSPQTDKIIWVFVPETFGPELGMDLQDQLKIPEILRLHNIEVVDCWQWLATPDSQWDDLCESLVYEAAKAPDTVAEFTSFCRTVNALDLLSAPIPDGESYQRICSLLIDLGYASPSTGQKLRLRDAETISFLAGGWLEHYVFMVARRLSLEGIVQDAACGLKLMVAPGVRNELDSAILSNNRVLFIECKAQRAKGASRKTGIAAEPIYKIDSIREIGTFRADAMLVTLAPPSEAESARLSIEAIATVPGKSLRDLDDILRKCLAH